MSSYTYAGWFVIDARLFIFVLLICFFMALGILALTFKGKRWHEYVTAFIGTFLVLLVVTVLVFNQVVGYPVFVIEEVFRF